MLFMRDISIKGKLILIIMLVSTAVLLITCSSIFYYSLIVFRHDTVRDLSSNAKMIGANVTAAITFDDPNSAEEILSSLSIKEQVSYACIFGRDGRIFVEYRKDSANNAEHSIDSSHLSKNFHSDHVDINVPIVLDNEVIGAVYLRSELGELHARYRDYTFIVFGITCACFLIAFILSSKLQKIVSSPIL